MDLDLDSEDQLLGSVQHFFGTEGMFFRRWTEGESFSVGTLTDERRSSSPCVGSRSESASAGACRWERCSAAAAAAAAQQIARSGKKKKKKKRTRRISLHILVELRNSSPQSHCLFCYFTSCTVAPTFDIL